MNNHRVTVDQLTRTVEVFRSLAVMVFLPPRWDDIRLDTPFEVAQDCQQLLDSASDLESERFYLNRLRDSWCFLTLYCHAALIQCHRTAAEADEYADAVSRVLGSYILGTCADTTSMIHAASLDPSFASFALRQSHLPPATLRVHEVAQWSLCRPADHEDTVRADRSDGAEKTS